jgi:hypothetical protein
MLETRIEELTAVVKALTAVLAAHPVATNPVVVKDYEDFKPKAESGVIKKREKEIVKAEIEDAKKLEVKPKTTTDTSLSSEPKSAPVCYDDVKRATNALSAAKGREITIDTLSRFGVKRATELDEAQWADYIAYAKEMTDVSMAGEVDE